MIKTIDKIDHNKCVACTACVNICPMNCIEMKMDEEGFMYPHVNYEKCISCGLCYKSCPTKRVKKQKNTPIILGMINRDKDVRENSSSGGVFYNLACSVLECGGIVCGATIDENMYVKHILIDSLDELNLLTKSKYVQSDLGNCYSLIKEELNKEKQVLFVGTPCQVYGLRCFLGKEYDSLIMVDLICQGVPSPKIWEDYIKEMENKRNAKGCYVSFRDKSLKGWNTHGMKIEFSNGTKYVDTVYENLFMNGFLKGYIDRKSCYNCQFRGRNRCSDLTIGDFWSVDNFLKDFNDNKGTSLVFINTEKGKKLVKTVRKSFFIKRVKNVKPEKLNIAYSKDSLSEDNRKRFYRKYNGRNAVSILEGELKKSKSKKGRRANSYTI